MNKHDFLESIRAQVANVPLSYWGDFSDSWGTVGTVLPMTVYTIGDIFNLHGKDKYDAFNLIDRNKKFFETSEHWETNSDHDCTGQCIGQSFRVRRIGGILLFFRTATYDV